MNSDTGHLCIQWGSGGPTSELEFLKAKISEGFSPEILIMPLHFTFLITSFRRLKLIRTCAENKKREVHTAVHLPTKSRVLTMILRAVDAQKMNLQYTSTGAIKRALPLPFRS